MLPEKWGNYHRKKFFGKCSGGATSENATAEEVIKCPIHHVQFSVHKSHRFPQHTSCIVFCLLCALDKQSAFSAVGLYRAANMERSRDQTVGTFCWKPLAFAFEKPWKDPAWQLAAQLTCLPSWPTLVWPLTTVLMLSSRRLPKTRKRKNLSNTEGTVKQKNKNKY